jgi:uncharacterized protein involved in propanediol utilization
MNQHQASAANVCRGRAELLEVAPQEGIASAISHHGEILQGVFAVERHGLVRGLVTLPRQGLIARARFTPVHRAELSVEPAWKIKALCAARTTLREVVGDGWGGRLCLSDGIPAGLGLGSSTSDVVAAIRAVADAFGIRLRANAISRLAVLSEGASDSVMFEDRTLLFAQREGYVIEELGPSLPEVEVLGFNTEPHGQGIATLDLELPAYSGDEVQMFRPLLGLLRAAVRYGRVEYMGRVATASARLNEKFLPKRHFDDLLRICDRSGAAGLQVAHSGTVSGLLFDPQLPDREQRIGYARRSIEALGMRESWLFRTGTALGLSS